MSLEMKIKRTEFHETNEFEAHPFNKCSSLLRISLRIKATPSKKHFP